MTRYHVVSFTAEFLCITSLFLSFLMIARIGRYQIASIPASYQRVVVEEAAEPDKQWQQQEEEVKHDPQLPV